jgi:hypothetical protein
MAVLDKVASPKRESVFVEQSLPAACCAGGKHYLHDFRENKPVKSEADGPRERARQDVQLRDSASKEQNFASDAGPCCTSKRCFTALENVSSQASDKWVSKQISAGGSNQLQESAGESRAENR